jgi:hypothetical protein
VHRGAILVRESFVQISGWLKCKWRTTQFGLVLNVTYTAMERKSVW